MHTTRRITVVVVVATLLLAAPVTPPRTWAQPVSPRPEPASPGAGARPPLATSATPSVTGRVQQYLLTPHGEVDGLLLADGTVVKFPPHLGVSLASTVRPGDSVSAVGFLGLATSYGRAMKALAITNTATGRTIVDQPPPDRPLPPDQRGLARVPLTVSGPLAHLLVNPKGDVDGLVLAAGEQVKFKPKSGAWVLTLLGPVGGGPVAASGYGTRNAFGTALEAESITIGGQTISLRGRGR
jgi:hypothetical protein